LVLCNLSKVLKNEAVQLFSSAVFYPDGTRAATKKYLVSLSG